LKLTLSSLSIGTRVVGLFERECDEEDDEKKKSHEKKKRRRYIYLLYVCK
jgi:hypothetical protein